MMSKVEHLFRVICSGRWVPCNLASNRSHPPRPTEPRYCVDHLSLREREVLLQVVDGHSTKRIAWHLGVSEATAKANLKSLMRKIRVNNRTQAAIWALDNLAELDPSPLGFGRRISRGNNVSAAWVH
jgi:two-component system nitrate/nitrite response regulator NarL